MARRKRMTGCGCCNPCPGGATISFARCGGPVEANYTITDADGNVVIAGDTGPSGTVTSPLIRVGAVYTITYTLDGDGPMSQTFKARCFMAFGPTAVFARPCCGPIRGAQTITAACGGNTFTLTYDGSAWTGAPPLSVTGAAMRFTPPENPYESGLWECDGTTEGQPLAAVTVWCDTDFLHVYFGWTVAMCLYEGPASWGYALSPQAYEDCANVNGPFVCNVDYAGNYAVFSVPWSGATSPLMVGPPVTQPGPLSTNVPWPGGGVTFTW